MIPTPLPQESPLALNIDPRVSAPGDFATAIPGLSLFRRDQPAPPAVCMIEPSLILVGRGEKRLWVGGEGYSYDPSRFLVTSLDLPQRHFTIDISAESLHRTTGLAQAGGRVNLEKALRAHDRLGGHIVSGHVDGIGAVTRFAQVGESWELRVMAPTELGKYLAYKGSITVNGVSLTVNEVVDSALGCEFSINLIPHTVENTALGELADGSQVNLEIDTVARYVERMLSAGHLHTKESA